MAKFPNGELIITFQRTRLIRFKDVLRFIQAWITRDYAYLMHAGFSVEVQSSGCKIDFKTNTASKIDSYLESIIPDGW